MWGFSLGTHSPCGAPLFPNSNLALWEGSWDRGQKWKGGGSCLEV